MKRLMFFVLSALAMLLTGCTGEHVGEAASEQVLKVNIKTEPFSLNPGLANDSTSGNVLLQTFEGLTRIGRDGKPEKALAKDIEVSEDYKTYIFTLRDANWSNGDQVTAHDFEYAWKWALDPDNYSKYAYQLYVIKNAKEANAGEVSLNQVGVTAINDETLKVELVNPTPYFLELAAFYTYLPINSRVAKKNPDWYQNAGEAFTSNGPFKLASWEHNYQITLEKNEAYWDADSVRLERIEMYMIDNANTELNMFENGEIHWAGAPTGQLPTEAIPALKDSGHLKLKPIAGTYWYKFNTEKEPLNNKKIRKALSYAINRKELVENITKSGQMPAMAAVPPSMVAENKKGYFNDANVKKARELLNEGVKELGYSSVGELPTITISYNTSESHAKIAQAIQQMWKDGLGIETELNNSEWAVYIDQLHQGNYQVGRMGWTGDFNDPINFLEIFKNKGGNNNTNWVDPKFQELLELSAVEKDAKKRVDLLKQAEQILIDDMPVAPIYFYTMAWVQADNLKNVYLSGLGNVQFKWAYFE